MALFSDGGFSSPDIWIVVAINLTASISLVLNLLVSRHNFYKKRSISRDMYMALSVTDFITCIVLPTTFSIGILRPKEEYCQEKHNIAFCENEYIKYERPATLTEKAMGSITWYLMISPLVITSALAICRWYQIKYPLRSFSRTAVEVSTAASCFLIGAYYTLLLFLDTPKQRTMMMINIQNAWNDVPFGVQVLDLLFDVASPIFMTTLPIIASSLTIQSIVKSKKFPGSAEIQRRRKIGTIKIAFLNVGNVVIAGLLLIISFIPMPDFFNTVVSCFVPILVSTYNPAIYTVLTKGIVTINSRVGK